MKKLGIVFLAVFMSIVTLSVSAGSVSADQDRLLAMQALIDEAANKRVDIDDNTTPGVTVLIKKGSEVLHHKSYGYAHLYDRDHDDSNLASDKGILLDNPRLATNETLYDLASVTKVMATTQAIMKLVSEGKVDLDAPVYTYLSGFEVNDKDHILVRDLLTHTSGLPQWEPSFLHVDKRVDELEYVKNLELMFDYGTFKYSDFSFMALAFIVEEVTGELIEDYLHDNFYAPLGMKDTMYVPLKNGISKDRIAATSWGNPYEWRMSNQRDYNVGYDTTAHQEAFDKFTGWRWRTLIGEVNDGNAGMGNEGVAGHAGLFSTAYDLSRLGDMMLNGGSLDGVDYYDEAVLKEFTTKVDGLNGRGLGWASPVGSATSGYVGKYASNQVFSHDGFTGTQVIFDPAYDLQIIILSNKQNRGPYNERGSYYSTYTMSREISQFAYEYVIEESKAVDKTALQKLVDESELLELSNYKPNSIAEFSSAFEKAKNVLHKENVLQVEVDNALEALKTAKTKLSLRADKTKLDELINKLKDTNLDGMTQKSKDAYLEAYTFAEEIAKDENITQNEVDSAYNKLLAAFEGLEKVPTTPGETPGGELPNTGFSLYQPFVGISTLLSGLGILWFNRKRNNNI